MPNEITMPLPIADAEPTVVRRERDRLRKAAARRALGMRPQAERRVTKDLAALAAVTGVSLRTIQRHREADTLSAFLVEQGMSEICPQFIVSTAGISDSFATSTRRSHADTMTTLRANASVALAEFNSLDPVFGELWPWLTQSLGREHT